MVEDLDAILAIWHELNYKIFSNHGGRFKCNFSDLRRDNYKIFSNHGGELIAILALFPLLKLYSCISDCYAENVGLDQEQDVYHGVVIKAQEQS